VPALICRTKVREIARSSGLSWIELPNFPHLITRDLAAGLAEAVLLALWNRQSVVLFSSTDAGTAVDPAVLAEGPGFVGRALRLERAAEGHVDSGLSAEAILGAADRALLTAKVAGGGIVAVSELDLGPLP
jgi:hypothetical protein